MSSGNGRNGRERTVELEALLDKAACAQAERRNRQADGPMHPAWEVFIRYCRQLGHGELERLKIQDGLPMMAELATRKVKFSP